VFLGYAATTRGHGLWDGKSRELYHHRANFMRPSAKQGRRFTSDMHNLQVNARIG
jgi:hypothetical protein